jgi:hypothetical protein
MMASHKRPLSRLGPADTGPITRARIRITIDNAEPVLLACFDTLAQMTRPRARESELDIFGFQPRLLKAISGLERAYRAVRSEEKGLVGRKKSLDAKWFRRRMAALARYRHALMEILSIARAIGDGFAWLFYENDRDLIVEHLKLQPQRLLPPDLGAAGERLTLENLRAIDGKLLLYHGITTFLRIGDISLIDPATMKVACIGELKTERADSSSVRVSISLVAGSAEAMPRLPAVSTDETDERSRSPMVLPPAMASRLERQKERMEEAIHRAATVATERVDAARMGFHYDALCSLVARSHERRFEWQSVGPGHVLGAVRIPNVRSLADTVLSTRKDPARRLTVGVEDAALGIMLKDSEDNSLLLSNVGGRSEYLRVRGETLPFVLWPIDHEVVRDILFRRVAIISLLNPAHLWAAIRRRGYEVSVDERGHFKAATKQEGNRIKGLENINWFLGLIHHALMTEDAVIGMIDQMADLADARVPPDGELRIELAPRIFRFAPTR